MLGACSSKTRTPMTGLSAKRMKSLWAYLVGGAAVGAIWQILGSARLGQTEGLGVKALLTAAAGSTVGLVHWLLRGWRKQGISGFLGTWGFVGLLIIGTASLLEWLELGRIPLFTIVLFGVVVSWAAYLDYRLFVHQDE
jgi:hypothetical protein